MSVEERVANLEEAFLALRTIAKRADERQDSMSESIKLLTQMIQRHDERFENVEAEQSNADVRIAALADAQIKTEESLNRIEAQMARTDADVHLATLEAQVARTDADVRIAALADAQIKTEESLNRIEAQMARTDERLNRLADTIERHITEGHNGQS
jgi:chromosome segregation ATPase